MTKPSPLEGLVERGWILPKPSPLACYQCELPYSGEHWVEAVVADDVWQRISPSGNSGGILCVNCMAGRLHHLGLAEVEVKLTAGPFRDSHSQLERVTEALERLRVLGLEQPTTEERDTYSDGFVAATFHAIRQIDQALAAIKEGGL